MASFGAFRQMKLALQVYRQDTRRWVSHLTMAASDANERKIEAERERLEAAGYRVRERVSSDEGGSNRDFDRSRKIDRNIDRNSYLRFPQRT